MGEGLYEAIGLGKLAGLFHLQVGGSGIAPSEIVLDGSGEQGVLLQYDRNAVTQGLEIVFPDILSPYKYLSLGRIVKTWDKGNQRGLGRTGTADDAQSLSSLYVEVYAIEGVFVRVLVVFETDALEGNAAVFYLREGVGRTDDGAFLAQHLHDSFGRGRGNGHKTEDHGEHHQA